ncbi:putative AC transposase, partial [Pseudolycoriella hygida]
MMKKKSKTQEAELEKSVQLTDEKNSDDEELKDNTENVDEAVQNMSTTRKKKGKTSYVWNHFSIRMSDDQKIEFAHCNYCESKYKLSGKSNSGTGNLNTHLKIKHLDKMPQEVNRVPEKFVFSQESYREALVDWIILSDQPFCECGVQSFSKMVDSLNPEAITISKETVKRDIIKKFAKQVELIKLRLKKVSSKLSFTLDAWTSKNVLPFLAIRTHWINDNWEYETVLLDFSFIKGKHSGLNISKIFLQCLSRFDIPLSQVLGVTIDNVSSNDTLISCLQTYGISVGINFTSQENHLRCMPHILNLCVQNIMKSLKIPLSDQQSDEQELYDQE